MRDNSGHHGRVAGFDVGSYVPRLLLARPTDAPRHWSEDGTLVFADISGFTRLSEQLARRGREGAEDLISTLVRIFTMLLSSSDDGGDLIKFGGDAMVIHYGGPDHARRATHAAYRMQQVMRVIGNVELTGARTRLRMSVGMHTGRFDFLLPGHEQWDLVVTGAGVTRMLALESAAGPGEVLLSPATAAALPASWLGVEKGPGVLLRRAGTVASTGSQILFRQYDEEQVWRLLPTVFRDRRDLLGVGSDHRRAAMAFVHVTGVDAMVAEDPVGTLRRMDDLAAVVEAAARETGISVLDTDVGGDGYKYFLAAGAPVSLEDPEGRMLRALLRITGADAGLEVRGGSAAGRVFAGTVGAPFRCTYAAMGDTTNLAARLCALAAPGEVVTHAPLVRRSLTAFAHDDPTEVRLKGKDEPVPVVRVGGVLGQRGRAVADVPFVGREAELAVIQTAFSGISDGRGGVVEIIGEAGLGKSRLADVAMGRLRLPVLTVTADPYGALVPYQTLRTLLRSLLALFPDSSPQEAGERLAGFVRAATPHLERWLPLLAPAVGADLGDGASIGELDQRFRTARTHEAVRDLLAALVPEPTALLFDDAQWVDESSAEALTFAFADLAERPWAVLLTRREGDDGLHGSDLLPTTALRPEPLGGDLAADLVARQGHGLRPDEIEAIVGRGGGNPYFLLQLAQTDGALPDTVEELVGARIDNLDALDRELLRDAAVLGSRFQAELYQRATGDAGFRDAVRSAALAPYVELGDDGVVVFRREIYREVAYGQLSFRSRRQLHLEVARAIEEEPRLAGDARLPMLSLHYHAAGHWEPAYRASLAAGDQAKQEWANEEAAQFFRRALHAGRRIGAPQEHLTSLTESIGDVCQVAGRYDDAARAFRDALRRTSEPDATIRLQLKLGRVLDFSGKFVSAQRLYRRARSTAEAAGLADPAIAAEIDVSDASSHLLQGRYEAARDLAARGWAALEPLPADDGVTRLRARAAYLHDSAAGTADGPKGLRFGDMPLRMFEGIGDLYYAGIAANNLGTQAYDEGRWDEAAACYTRARAYAQRAGDRIGSAIMGMNLAQILGHQGHFADAESLLDDSMRTFTVLEAPLFLGNASSMAALVALESGDRDRAERLMAEARRLHVEVGSDYETDDDDVWWLELLLARRRYDEVVAQARALLGRRKPVNAFHEARARCTLGTALSRGGDSTAGRAELERALGLAVSMESDYDVARIRERLAELGGPDAGEQRAHAVATYRKLGILAHQAQSA